jgi:hypothetical protein
LEVDALPHALQIANVTSSEPVTRSRRGRKRDSDIVNQSFIELPAAISGLRR